MGHGIAIINEIIFDLDGNVVVEKGEEGLVTAYLPEMEKFAVMFTNNRWYTFSESEESFLKRFNYTK